MSRETDLLRAEIDALRAETLGLRVEITDLKGEVEGLKASLDSKMESTALRVLHERGVESLATEHQLTEGQEESSNKPE